MLSSARQRELPSRHELQPCGSVGEVLPHPSRYLRLGSGKEGQKPLWALGLELCWNQLRSGQRVHSRQESGSGAEAVRALPSASNYGPTRPAFYSHLLQVCSMTVGTRLHFSTPSGQGYPTGWLHWRQLDIPRGAANLGERKTWVQITPLSF